MTSPSSQDVITLTIDAMEPGTLQDEIALTGVTMKRTGKYVGMGSEVIELTGPRESIAQIVAAGWGEDELEMHSELNWPHA